MVMSETAADGEMKVLADVANGIYRLAEFSQGDVARAAEVVTQYRDLKIGLADASIVVLAAKYKTTRVLTFDQRHFRAMKTLTGAPFTILPADAQLEG
jgi:predicted nucleic acid-binding protein